MSEKEKTTGLALLREPFADHQVSRLPKETRKQIDERKSNMSAMLWDCKECGGAHHKKAIHLDYVGHAAVTDRLLDADPEWTWEPIADPAAQGLPVVQGGMWITLTVCGVSRIGFGCADGKTGGDAVKEIIGDALRNAGMRFGMALDLWHKGDLHGDAQDEAPNEKPKARQQEKNPEAMPDEEYDRLASLAKASKTSEASLKKYYKVDDLRHLDQKQYGEAVKGMTEKLAKQAQEQTNAEAGEFSGLSEGDLK